MKPIQATKVSTMRIIQICVRIYRLLLAAECAKFSTFKKLVMPVISLQIPVNELLETVRYLLANGKEVRAELVSCAVGYNDCDSSLKSSQNLLNSQ